MFSKIHNAIPEYIKFVVETKLGCEAIFECDYDNFIEEAIQEGFNDWESHYNFHEWADSDVNGIFENPHLLLEMIMIISNYFKKNFDMDWVSTQEKLTPEIVINTYAYVYVKTEIDAEEIITNELDKTFEEEEGCEETKN